MTTTIAQPSQRTFLKNLQESEYLIKTTSIRKKPINYYVINERLLNIAENIEGIEPELLDWIDTIEQDAVMYDLGASNGPFSTYASLKDLQVVAFEPEAQNFSVLEMNHYLNRTKIKHPIISLNLALSNKTGLGKIYCRDCVAGTHVKILDQPLKVLEKDIFEAKHVQYVMKMTLDEAIQTYNLPNPKYIKIDVDGAEENLLEGAKNTLDSFSLQQVFIEIAYPETRGKPVIKILEKHGFTLTQKFQVEHYEGLANCIFKRI